MATAGWHGRARSSWISWISWKRVAAFASLLLPWPAAAAPEADWVEESARREAHVERLGALLTQDLCRALVEGRGLDALAAAPLVEHDLPASPPPWADGGAQQLASGAPGTLRRVSAAAWRRDAAAHFGAFALVHDCEHHVFAYDESETGRSLGVDLHLDGLDPDGFLLEEGLRLRLTFSPEDRLTALRVLRQERARAREPLFADVTEAWLGPVHFLEEGFTPLDLAAPGNLDFGGLAVLDVDGDGRLEIYVARSGPNLLFERDETGAFREVGGERGVADAGNGRGVVFADLDADGDLDLVVANMTLRRGPRAPLRIHRQGDDGVFRDDTGRALAGRTWEDAFSHAAVADVDADGDLDVFVAGYGDERIQAPNHVVAAGNGRPNLLLVNDGSGVFREEAASRGLIHRDWSYAGAFADADLDGDLDLFVANDWGPDRLYRNDGHGRFEDVAPAWGLDHPGAGMGAAWTDLDGDARLDLYVSNMYSNAGNRLVPHAREGSAELREALLVSAQGNAAFLNRGGGRFDDATDELGLRDGGWAWGAVPFDFDLDGDEDVYQVNGYYTGTITKDL